MQEIIKNTDITLERLAIKDSIAVYVAIKNSYQEISPWLSWLTPDYNQNNADDFIHLQINNWVNNIEYTFSIKNHTGNLLGAISLHLYDKQNAVASLGYWMNSNYTGKGICTQAVKLLIANALIPLKLSRIEVIVATENFASQKVAESAGAKFEAILKDRILLKEQAVDAKMYAFTN